MGKLRKIRKGFKNALSRIIEPLPQWKQQYYFHLHLALCLLLGFFGGLIIYLIELGKNVSFIDAVFTSYSSICITGFVVLEHASLSIASQLIMLLLILLGGLTISPLPGVVMKTLQSYQRMNFARKWAKTHNYFVSRWEQKRGPFLRLKQLLGIAKIPVTDYEFLSMLVLVLLLFLLVFVFIVIGFIFIGIWLSIRYIDKLDRFNPWYLAFFISLSAFNNAGMTPFNDNLSRFSADFFLLMFICFLVLMGNTLFPAFLRLVVYLLSLIFRKRYNEPLFQYILQHHHRLCIHLFPILQTQIYILVTIILLTFGTFVGFISELGTSNMVGRSWFNQITISFFQSVNTRSAGFNVVNIGGYGFSMLLVYMVMMRIKPQMFCALNEEAYGVETVIGRIKRLEGSEDDPNSKGVQVEKEILDANADKHSSIEKTTDSPTFGFINSKTQSNNSKYPKEKQVSIGRRRSFSDSLNKLTNDSLILSSSSSNYTNHGSISDTNSHQLSHQPTAVTANNKSKPYDLKYIPRGKSMDFIRNIQQKGLSKSNTIHRSNTITFGIPVHQEENSFKKSRRGLFVRPLKQLYKSPGEEKPMKVRILNFFRSFSLRLYEHFYSVFVANTMWLLVFLFLICTIEESKMRNSPVEFSFLKVVFELISAYGSTGYSIGVSNSHLSFSSVFSVYSKIIIIITLIIGRHRGLKLSNRDQNFESQLPKYVADYRPTRDIAILKRRNELDEEENESDHHNRKSNLERLPSSVAVLRLNSHMKRRGSSAYLDNQKSTNTIDSPKIISVDTLHP